MLILAGGAGGFYLWNHDPALKRRLQQTFHDVPVTAVHKPAPKPPADAPVGFNATKTAFVLPYHLGYLPAPELAWAKSDPAYAAGLANLNDWTSISPPSGPGGLAPNFYGWYYIGNYGLPMSSGISRITTNKGNIPSMWYGYFSPHGGNDGLNSSITGVAIESTTNIPVRASRLSTIPIPEGTFSTLAGTMQGEGYTIITPSTLEARAAPVGRLTVHGTAIVAFCVPSPEAIIHDGHVVTPSGIHPITAGPATIFAVGKLANSPLYDQGATSCAGFS